jgi:hypothetical protein
MAVIDHSFDQPNVKLPLAHNANRAGARRSQHNFWPVSLHRP